MRRRRRPIAPRRSMSKNTLVYPNVGDPVAKGATSELPFFFTVYRGSKAGLTATAELMKNGQVMASVRWTSPTVTARGSRRLASCQSRRWRPGLTSCGFASPRPARKWCGRHSSLWRTECGGGRGQDAPLARSRSSRSPGAMIGAQRPPRSGRELEERAREAVRKVSRGYRSTPVSVEIGNSLPPDTNAEDLAGLCRSRERAIEIARANGTANLAATGTNQDPRTMNGAPLPSDISPPCRPMSAMSTRQFSTLPRHAILSSSSANTPT